MRPDGTVSVRITVPANLLIAVTVIVEMPEAPALTVTGLAATVKSLN